MKKCMECGSKVVGRSDKKFCDSNCRNAYHNEKIRPAEKQIRIINRFLSKNRNLLEKLSLEEVERVPLVLMKTMGFDLNYFTSRFTNGDQEVFFVYDLAFRLEAGEIVILVDEIENYRLTG